MESRVGSATNMVEYRARIRGTPAAVRFARRAIGDYARLCGFGADEVADIGLAAGEALANAVEHGSKHLGTIDVSCAFDGCDLTIEIGDVGPGFDVDGTVERRRDPQAVRGFGISIMHAIMDRVHYSQTGTTVRLVRRARHNATADGAREEA
ncbi:MAG: hypothetical protein NVSMB19_11080 [Vulcanimicrobiaceae bacterium]